MRASLSVVSLLLLQLLSAAFLPLDAAPPQPPAAAAPAEDGAWTMPGKNQASTRYSGLDEITIDNVANLKVEFTFSTGVLRGHEAAPIVKDGTMYIVTPFPNYVYALDLTKPGAP